MTQSRLVRVLAATLVLLAGLWWTVGPWSGQSDRHPQSLSRLTPSVTTFGYDETRSGHVVSYVDASTALAVVAGQPALVDLAKRSLRFKPLYIRSDELPDEWAGKFAAGRRILIVTTPKGLEAIDVDAAERLWEVKTLWGHGIAATPVIDQKAGKIYFYSRRYGRWAGFEHQVYQVNLDGGGLRSVSLDINGIFATRYPDLSGNSWHRRVHCKTAMGLNRTVAPPYVFFGCSLQTGQDAASRYGVMRSLSGLVVSVPLDLDGNLKGSRSHRAFFTSEMRKEDATGFDSGIYNSGAGPALLPDGSILVATGNGPVFPELGNFGCSMIRLDGISLRPVVHADGMPSSFSHSLPPFNECWHLNVEYSNSSAAVIEGGGRLTAAVITKDGFLEVFDPLQIHPSRSGVARTRVAGGKTYSQPAMISNGQGVRIVSLAKGKPHDLTVNDLLLTDASTLSGMQDIEQKPCFGWLSAWPNANTAGLSLLYSGPIRNDYAVAIVGSEFHNNLKSFFSAHLGHRGDTWLGDGLWGPYVDTSHLGYSVGANYQSPLPKSKPEQFETMWRYFDGRKQPSSPFEHETFWLLRNLDDQRDCRLPRDLGLNAVWEVKRRAVLHAAGNDAINAHDYNPSDGTLRLAWRLALDAPDQLMDAHPVISSNAEGEIPVVLALVYADAGDGSVTSAVLFVDTTSGKLVNRFEFDGLVRFSMPLVFDEHIMIPTLDNGLQVLSVVKDEDQEDG